LLGRRAFVAGSVAASALPAFAGKPMPPKVGAIRWPGSEHDLHGFMAIPAKAHGRQPAVLIVPDGDGADKFALSLTDWLALAGFVACIPRALPSLDDALATVRWLATNRYATGKVAAIGLGRGGELVDRIAVSPQALLAAGVTFGVPAAVAGPVPLRRFGALNALAADAYDHVWQEILAFLKEQLA